VEPPRLRNVSRLRPVPRLRWIAPRSSVVSRLTLHPLSLALACLAGGCGVERLTAVEPIDNQAAEAAAHGSSPLDATMSDDSDAPPSSGDEDVDASMCEDAAFSTPTPFGIWNDVDDAGYNVFNNVWDTDAGPGPNYYTRAGDASVGAPLGSFEAITSTFAEVGPDVGVYEFAYDIWMNGIADASSSQILIWVDNVNRVPAGSLLTTTSLDGRMYEVWTTPDNAAIVLKSTTPFAQGTVDLFKIINWAMDESLLRSDSTVWQIDFGVEIESTGGQNATFQVEDFSITTM